VVARGLARRGCAVVGLDKSSAQLEQARKLDLEAGVAIEYVVGSAEETGLPDATRDVVTAGQCWHWFDRPRAAEELRRVLVPKGRLAIAHFDWLPWAGSVTRPTEALILAHNPSWAMADGTGLYPTWLADVAGAGFRDIETFSFDVSVPYGHEEWRGRVRASAGVGAALPPEAVARFDAALKALLAEHFPKEPMEVPHRVWAVVCRAP
jgi:SAM-dependent methyltransferase